VKIPDKSNYVKYKSLKQEANILNIRHVNIISILKIVDCKTYGAVIMEGLDGKCLQSVLDNHKVDLLHRLFILSDIVAAIKFCHQNGIIHFDIKPQNIFVAVNTQEEPVGRSYVCKLFDFGCSMRVSDPESCFGVSFMNFSYMSCRD
jgi:serine/threonine protein kinase